MAWARASLLVVVCLIHIASAVETDNTSDLLDVRVQLPGGEAEYIDSFGKDKCLDQLHSSLEKLRKRQSSSKSASLIDLSGYALHQSLRNAPVEMYVTDIKVRTPSVGSWVQVQKCQFSRNAEMRTNLLFNDLLVSGVVRLMPGESHLSPQQQQPSQSCTMTLRLRRAGLDLKATPAYPGGAKASGPGRGLQLRTESNFVEPHFLSVHAYGCKIDQWAREGWFAKSQPESPEFRSNDESAEIRIISLGEEPQLDLEHDNEPYRQRIITFRSPGEKLAAVLSVKKHIDQNTNAVFQTHGPFSQFASSSSVPVILNKPLFTSSQDLPRPAAAPSHTQSTITELDEKLRPIGQVAQQPFASLVSSAPQKQPAYTQSQPLYDVSSEMEDVFLRGAKALLTKYLEKQLEVPLKEALMTKIGYTVSYG